MESSQVAVRSSGLVTPLGHRTRINGWLQCAQTFAQRSVGPGISAMQVVRRAAIVRRMTLEQLSALAQIVGAGALLASLIFVGLQIRQNTHSQRVVAVESLAAAIAAINVPAMQSPQGLVPGEPRRACDRALFPILLLQAARAGLVSIQVARTR